MAINNKYPEWWRNGVAYSTDRLGDSRAHVLTPNDYGDVGILLEEWD